MLHDYGHFVIEDPDLLVLKSLDGKHEDVGFNFLKDYFKPEVTEPIKLHVQAKRYLCRNKSYYELLSDPSKISLELQGGIMDEEELEKQRNIHDQLITKGMEVIRDIFLLEHVV